jgi:hypothetical protein
VATNPWHWFTLKVAKNRIFRWQRILLKAARVFFTVAPNRSCCGYEPFFRWLEIFSAILIVCGFFSISRGSFFAMGWILLYLRVKIRSDFRLRLKE